MLRPCRFRRLMRPDQLSGCESTMCRAPSSYFRLLCTICRAAPREKAPDFLAKKRSAKPAESDRVE
uniref:Uncharacterized protein n=1 Tax=Triticum urartu TaxID=4572 RepID=A0A8R7JZ85_TRIUA